MSVRGLHETSRVCVVVTVGDDGRISMEQET
jgi:hypothetical protein